MKTIPEPYQKLLSLLLITSSLSIIGLSIGIILPQLFPRDPIGGAVKIPSPVFHYTALIISIGLPWFNSIKSGWGLSHRLLALFITTATVALLWLGLDWNALLMSSWRQAW